MSTTYTQSPNSVLDYSISWSQLLSATDTIATSSWSISPSGELQESDSLASTFDTDTTTVYLEGGVVGSTYLVTNHITTTEGLADDRAFYIFIAEAGSDATALGSSNLCAISDIFYDAGGSPMQGVYVRFTPDPSELSILTVGLVAREVTTSSDSSGRVSFNLIRGTTGTLTITGLGICRQVTIPDRSSAGLLDLVSGTDDPLEVQRVDFVSLPRSS